MDKQLLPELDTLRLLLESAIENHGIVTLNNIQAHLLLNELDKLEIILTNPSVFV